MAQKKLFYTMGEISEMFDVNVSLIRHWEKEFEQLKPARNKRGNRLFSEQDLENFKIIYHLVRERGLTLDGARRAMKRGAVIEGSALERDAQIIEKLQNLRSMLLEIKDLLESSKDEERIIIDPELDLGELQVEWKDDSPTAEELMLASELPTSPQAREGEKRKARDGEGESRELFAFFEQRLF